MSPVLVSAHRGGVGADRAHENTLSGFTRALDSGADFVEVDVRRTRDGHLVVSHDDAVELDGTVVSIASSSLADLSVGSRPPVLLEDVVAAIGRRARVHLDVKSSDGDVELVAHLVDDLGADQIIVTTSEDVSVRRLRAWSRVHAPTLLVGLSSGARVGRNKVRASRWTTVLSVFARRRIRRSDANLVVAHRLLARYSLRRYALRRGLPLLVWTVDEPAELARWMNDPAVWMVTTNYPERALAARTPSTPDPS